MQPQDQPQTSQPVKKIVGPGSFLQEDVAPDSLLTDANEYEYITILNPLTDDFQVLVAQDVPVTLPTQLRHGTQMTNTEGDLVKNYGLSLKNRDHASKKYIHNTAVIKAGHTMNFRGNEAKVVLRQLVNEIMQREGNRRMLADPFQRRLVEERIVKSRGSIEQLMGGGLQTPQQQVMQAIDQSNQDEVNHESSFPGLDQPAKGDAPASPKSGDDNSASPARDNGVGADAGNAGSEDREPDQATPSTPSSAA